MSCRADVRKAVYDKVMDELVEGRYTFTRLSDDTIQVNGRVDSSKSKAQSREQARAIAKQLIARTQASFANGVRGYITENSPYDPITVTFNADRNYVDYLYSNLPIEQQTDRGGINASPAINSVYNSSAELKNIGTSQEYADYVNSIFPESKNKNVFYHGLGSTSWNDETNEAIYPTIDTFKVGEKGAIWFAEDIVTAQEYSHKIIPVVLDVRNTGDGLMLTSDYYNDFTETDNINPEIVAQARDKGYDSLTGISQMMHSEFIVFDPSQIHILANQKDISKFQHWVYANRKYSPAQERDMVSMNIGPNQYSAVSASPTVYPNPPVGYFTKYIAMKKANLRGFQQRLLDIERERKNKNTTQARLTELAKEKRKVKEEIEGIPDLGIKGLSDEILQLEKNAAALAVGYYVDMDMQRLQKLAASDNIANLNEAKRIIDFYDLAGTFQKGVDNPFFTELDIFHADPNDPTKTLSTFLLDKATRDQFEEWRKEANGLRQQVNDKIAQVSVQTVNSNNSVQKTYQGKTFSFEDITNKETGLKDTDWASMWLMDITKGIFSHNGILPQVMFSELSNLINEDLGEARKLEERVDALNPKVMAKLKVLNQTLKAAGVIDKDTTIYQIFKEINQTGHETGGFIRKYSPKFFDSKDKANHRFWKDFNAARTIADDVVRAATMKMAYAELRAWRRKNTMIMDVGAIPEIVNDPEFAAYSSHFNSIKVNTHKNELIAAIGQKEYDRQAKEQVALLRRYTSDRESMLETIMDREGVTLPSALSSKGWAAINNWEKRNSPFAGVDDFNKVIYASHVDSLASYNVFIPRKYVPNIAKDASGYNYVFTDSTTLTGNFSEPFEKYIESDPDLSDFHDLLIDTNEFIRDCLPYEKQKTFSANSLPAFMKSSAEILADTTSNTNILRHLFEAFKNLWDKVRLSFGVVEQSQQAYTVKNPITGKAEYKPNDSFISNNERDINERMAIEKARFAQLYPLNAFGKPLKIDRHTVLTIAGLNDDALLLVAQYLDVTLTSDDLRTRNLSAITNITGPNVEIGRIIRDYSIHTVVQAHSFDLAKLIKLGTYTAAMYSARNKALPVLEVMKNHYESIKNPKVQNLSKQMFNVHEQAPETEGTRDRAKRQIEDWFERVVLGNYGLKHKHELGMKRKKQTDIRLLDKRIYSKEDRQKFDELNELIAKEQDDDTAKYLTELRDRLGKVRTSTAMVENLLAWIRTVRLGYNLSSGVTNFVEGFSSNMIVAATGEYFDPNEIYYGYHVAKLSFVKNAVGWIPGVPEHKLAKKNRMLMDKFRVLMNTANELQKNSVKTLSDKLASLHPHALNERIEFNNQSPIMIAMLRTLKIKDVNGKEARVWDAYEPDGTLKADFKTPENIENWEELKGEQYQNFKTNLSNALVLAHGNYDTLRGMLAKSSTSGKALMMFKSWLPQQLYWRFATKQDDILSGTKGFKGKYWSLGTGTAGMFGTVVGGALFGPFGLPFGAVVGAIAGNQFGTDPGVHALKQTLVASKVLVKKMIGMPINTLIGRKIIGTSGNEFDKWVGNKNFTQQDANALKANMSDLAMQLMYLALFIIVKSIFWDDDKEHKEEDPEGFARKRMAHNLLANRLMQLSSQAGMYVNPSDLWESTVGSNAVIMYLTEVGKEVDKLGEALRGRDITQSGENAGESGLINQTVKTFLPGVFKSPFSLGFESQTKRQFEKSSWDAEFYSRGKEMESDIKRERAERRKELKEEMEDQYSDPDELKKEVEKIVNEEIPTAAKLKKMGITEEEYEEQQDDE